jgi:hypothetical protein
VTIRPIIFSAMMVRALHAGRKTQTRRLASSPLARCVPGDRLYVREAVSCGGTFSDVVEVRYRAHEGASHTEFVEQVPVASATTRLPDWPRYCPAIHMPRWASRLTLIVDEVRTEPLHAITEAGAVAEGIERRVWDVESGDDAEMIDGWAAARFVAFKRGVGEDAREGFQILWNSLHDAKAQRWLDNPTIVALTFRVIPAQVDRAIG